MRPFIAKLEISEQTPNDQGYAKEERLTTLVVTGDTHDEAVGKMYDLLTTLVGEGPSDEAVDRAQARSGGYVEDAEAKEAHRDGRYCGKTSCPKCNTYPTASD